MRSFIPAACLAVLVGLVGCSRSFWYREPCVASHVQVAPPTACPPASPSYGTSAVPSYGPSCPPSPAPEPCPQVPSVPPSDPPAYAQRPSSGAVSCSPTLDEQRVLESVNRIRQARGLRPLAWNPQLQQAAAAHSDEQYRHGYMGHGSPDPARRTLLQRIQLTGYDGRCFGEVVAWGYKSPQAVVEGWMNSRDHRAILVDRDLTEAGFSRVGDYWTGNFGTPRQPRAAAPQVPPSRAPATAYAPAPSAPRTAYAPPSPPPTAYQAPAPVPAPAPPARTYFQRAPQPVPQPTFRAPLRGG